jgi:pimeloyl-ACP methyl ester carboxylesterase
MPGLLRFALSALAFSALASSVALASSSDTNLLTERAEIKGLGSVAYRSPTNKNNGPAVVLFQGVFGGTTYRHMHELRERLDQAGARVYTLDLPGTGLSDSPKIVYTIEALNGFVASFLREVVREPALVVAEQVMGLASLNVSKTAPELFKSLILISPPGVLYLAGEPNERQNQLFDKTWNDDAASLQFFQSLVSEKSARFYLTKAYHDPAQVTDERVQEITMTSQYPEQRWATISFVAGRVHQSFAEAARNVTIPVTAIFGQYPSAPTSTGAPETADLFQKVAPQFRYEVIADAANLPHREKPDQVAKIIIDELKTLSTHLTGAKK